MKKYISLTIILILIFFLSGCSFIKKHKELSDLEAIKERGYFTNKYLNIGILALIIVQLIVFLTPLGKIFSLVSISIGEFIFVIIVNIFSFAILELIKPILSKYFKDE